MRSFLLGLGFRVVLISGSSFNYLESAKVQILGVENSNFFLTHPYFYIEVFINSPEIGQFFPQL